MCNNNCCMCCNCNTNTNNEETTQEVVYTSVCNSDTCQQFANQCQCCNCCNCEKYKGSCEDDPENMVLALQEHMEECCQTVGERLDTVECELDREICRSKAKDNEHDDKIDDLYQRESIDVNYVEYVDSSNPRVIKFWHKYPAEDNKADLLIYTINAEPFLKDGILDSVDLESDGHTLHFVWNTDAGKVDQHVDLDRLVQPIATNVTNLKDSVAGYNPELPYDGTAVTVGQIDGKQFRVHLATFPELVSTVSPDYANNRFSVTTNKGNTSYIDLKNSAYYKDATINDHTITLTKENNTTTTIVLPDNNTDTLVKQKNCIDDAAIPVLLAYSANPTSNTAAEAFYSTVTINPHTSFINGTADKAVKDDDGHNIADTYVSGGSFNNSNRNLTLVNPAGTTLATINIPDANTDTNNYVTQAQLVGNILKITQYGINGTVDVDLSGVSGTTNVTYGGNTVTIQQAITAIENRLNALEGLWKKTSNNDGLEPVTATHKVYGYGFYDTSVSQPAS